MSGSNPEKLGPDARLEHDWSDPALYVSHWHSWGSPVGLGLFFVLIAVTVEIFRYAFH